MLAARDPSASLIYQRIGQGEIAVIVSHEVGDSGSLRLVDGGEAPSRYFSLGHFFCSCGSTIFIPLF